MKNKILAASAAMALAMGGVVLVAGPASAHNHTDGVSCQYATVDLTNYDGPATVKVTLDGTVVHDTAPFGGQYHYSQALTFDATHQSHTMIVEVLSGDAGYSFTHTDVSAANCYTPPKDVPILPVIVHPATCTTGVTYDVPEQNADIKYGLNADGVTRPVPGNGFALPAGQTLTITAHTTAEAVANGDAPNSYSITITGGDKNYNASCVDPQTCVVSGPYHENDDNTSTLTPAGLAIFSKGDGKATDGGGYSLSSGNAQGFTTADYTKTGEVGNGIFFRLIFDLSADGGPSYASFSGLGTHVDQTTVAGYGSKAVFTGKSIADVANTWPKNKIVAFIWQTGSSYVDGDGAVLTGFSGYCGNGNFIPTVPGTTHRTTDTTGEVTCNVGGQGGGSYNETFTAFTTGPVWNDKTSSYDLVETVDSGYPVVTPHTVMASLEECPIHATPVDPTVKTICSADDSITLATTANITYAITASDKNGATVTATPADATVLDATDGWALQEDGTATHQVVYDNSVCLVFPPALALTGSVPGAAFDIGLGILAVGFTVCGILWFKRREERLEDEAIDHK